MSYRCELCKEAQEVGERPTTVVVETRDRIYDTNPDGSLQQGWEVVREIKMCPPCLEMYEAREGSQ